MDLRVGWVRFTAWALVGAFLAAGVSQVGVLTVPPGLALALVLGRRGRSREMLGLLEGAGAVSAAIGLLNLDYRPCPNVLVLAPGQTSASCGGFDGTPWLIAGLAAMGFAAVLYGRVNRHD